MEKNDKKAKEVKHKAIKTRQLLNYAKKYLPH